MKFAGGFRDDGFVCHWERKKNSYSTIVVTVWPKDYEHIVANAEVRASVWAKRKSFTAGHKLYQQLRAEAIERLDETWVTKDDIGKDGDYWKSLGAELWEKLMKGTHTPPPRGHYQQSPPPFYEPFR